jgi:hypothetical protein
MNRTERRQLEARVISDLEALSARREELMRETEDTDDPPWERDQQVKAQLEAEGWDRAGLYEQLDAVRERDQRLRRRWRWAICLVATYAVGVGVFLAFPAGRSSGVLIPLVGGFVFMLVLFTAGILALAIVWALLWPPVRWVFEPLIDCIAEIKDDLRSGP